MSAQSQTTETVDLKEGDSSGYILPKIKPLNIGDVVVDPPILQAPMAGFTNYDRDRNGQRARVRLAG